MFKRNLIPVWVGILMMASFFLVGQDWGSSSTGVSLHVVDADGNDVGLYIESSEMFDQSLEVVYDIDFWTGEPSPYLDNLGKLYESTDCSGDWYVDDRKSSDTFTLFDDSTVYRVTAVAGRTIRSKESEFGCGAQGGEERLVGISWTAVALPTSFPAPLRLEAR
jgi:hypothetical protein